MICPHCLQGEILKVKITKTSEIINICDECDTAWKNTETISDADGKNMKFFTDGNSSWRQFQVIGKA